MNAMSAAGGYTVALAVAYVLAMAFVVRPIVHLLYKYFRARGDVADSSMFLALLILFLLLSAFTAEVIGLLIARHVHTINI